MYCIHPSLLLLCSETARPDPFFPKMSAADHVAVLNEVGATCVVAHKALFSVRDVTSVLNIVPSGQPVNESTSRRIPILAMCRLITHRALLCHSASGSVSSEAYVASAARR